MTAICRSERRGLYVENSRIGDESEAKSFFLEMMMNSDGEEHDRYSGIYIQLQNGLNICTDE